MPGLTQKRPPFPRLRFGTIPRALGDRDLEPESDPRAAGPVPTLCWLGLVTGLLEMLLVAGQRAFVAAISLESLRLNRHFVWMIPAANLLLFGALGMVLAALGRRRAGLARALAWSGGGGLLAFGLLDAVEVLSPITCLIVACGATIKAPVSLGRRSGRLGRLIRATLPPLLVVLAILGVASTARLASRERRALELLPPPPASSPNVLLVVLDDVRADSLSLHGRERPTTPRLEQLAGRGLCFDAARSTSSWTLPSHASLFTGRWPHELSVGWNLGLDGTHATLAGWLSRRGYATAGFVGNTYYGNARYGLDRGFARYQDFVENETVSLFETLRTASLGRLALGALGYSMNFEPGEHRARKTAASINRDALAWLEARPQGRPFFLFLNYYDAHAPFVPPDEATRRFGACARPEAEQVAILKQAARAATTPGLTPAEREAIGRRAAEVRLDGYESCIAYVDQQLGSLVDELERRGLMENTLLIVTSDHGEHVQERGFCGHGMSLYRREVHVPLVVVPPSSRAVGRRIADPVSLRDVPATVVDLLGLGGPSPFPGRSLARHWQPGGAAAPAPEVVRSELGHQTTLPPNPAVPASLGTTTALTGALAVYLRNSQGREELYDRNADPDELRNLIDEVRDGHPLYPEKVALSRLADEEKAR